MKTLPIPESLAEQPKQASPHRHVIVDLKTGQIRPATDRAPVLSSAGASWKGLMLEQHESGEVEFLDVALPCHSIFLQLEAPAILDLKMGSGPFRRVERLPGRIGIVPAMMPFSVRTRESGGFVAVTLEPSFVSRAVPELAYPDRWTLLPQENLEDRLLRASVLTLKAEVESGNPGGPVYAESVGAGVVAHLARHYSARTPPRPMQSPKLPQARLRRVVKFIHEHLAEDISLRALAAVAELSPFHFARQFKQSAGLAPYKYVIQCRVERARELLLAAPCTLPALAEVAQQVGFCDPSHLALHFKRMYGLTPKAFVLQTTSRRRAG